MKICRTTNFICGKYERLLADFVSKPSSVDLRASLVVKLLFVVVDDGFSRPGSRLEIA